MYETLMMLKPGHSFPLEQMEELVRNVCESRQREIVRDGTRITVRAGESALRIDFSNAPWVIEESAELAEEYGLNCVGCAVRYEMRGEEAAEDLELFNDALLICNRLEDLGFVLMSPWREEAP